MRYEDGLPLDEVGPWAREKHERLRRYVDISRATRRKFVQGHGGATYIDLYCGCGRAVIRDTGECVDGSPLVAFKSARDGGVPFSEMHIADLDSEKCRAAETRIAAAGGSALVGVGGPEETVHRIVKKLNPFGLHFAFLDPYSLDALPFSVIKALGSLRRMDLLIHFSIQDLQRNLSRYLAPHDDRLDRFAPGWREAVDIQQSKQKVRADIFAYWASKAEEIGLPPSRRVELVSGAQRNQRLYWLVFISRSEFAKDLWDKIANIARQGELPF